MTAKRSEYFEFLKTAINRHTVSSLSTGNNTAANRII